MIQSIKSALLGPITKMSIYSLLERIEPDDTAGNVSEQQVCASHQKFTPNMRMSAARESTVSQIKMHLRKILMMFSWY
jgi:hypothetical protein